MRCAGAGSEVALLGSEDHSRWRIRAAAQGDKPAYTPENQAVRRTRRAALQAGGHRFDPGWLHLLSACDLRQLRARGDSNDVPREAEPLQSVD